MASIVMDPIIAYTVPNTQTLMYTPLSRVVSRDNARTVRSAQMSNELARRASFRNWFSIQYAQALAAAGFIPRLVADQAQYSRYSNRSVVVRRPRLEYIPYSEHYRYAPTISDMHQPPSDFPSHHSPSNEMMVDDVGEVGERYTEPTMGTSRHESQKTPENNNNESEASLCKICINEEMCILFRPCGHLLTCRSCAGQLSSCPVCRQNITERIRAFISF